MYDRLRRLLLRWLKVPPEPLDPMGDVRSLRVFRAAPGYLRYLTLGWAVSQAALLAGVLALVFALAAATIADAMPPALSGGLAFLILLFFLAGAVLTYFTLRLNYDTRWYKVTDRSLRIRAGVWKVHEMTMTFANVQNITITQGPIQRLFGIADVRVETAGGGHGSGGAKGEGPGADMHVGIFRGVDNPVEIRALMLERLRYIRDAGLGDPDDQHVLPPVFAAGSAIAGTAATRELLTAFRDEARALRRAVEAATPR